MNLILRSGFDILIEGGNMRTDFSFFILSLLFPIIALGQDFRSAQFVPDAIEAKKRELLDSIAKSKAENAQTYDLNGQMYNARLNAVQKKEATRGQYCSRHIIMEQVRHQFGMACRFEEVRDFCLQKKMESAASFTKAMQTPVPLGGLASTLQKHTVQLNDLLSSQISAREQCYKRTQETFLSDSCQNLYDYKFNPVAVEEFGQYCNESDATALATDVKVFMENNFAIIGAVRDDYIKMRLSEIPVAKKIIEIEEMIVKLKPIEVSTNMDSN